MSVADIEAEIATIKKACAHHWKPWLGKAAWCRKCGTVRDRMPCPRRTQFTWALKNTREAVERMLST